MNASQVKAIQDAKKAGENQIARLKQEYNLARTAALSHQASAFQKDILNLKGAFKQAQTTYQINCDQLKIEARVAQCAFEEKSEFKDALRKFYVSQQLSSREGQTYEHNLMLINIFSVINAKLLTALKGPHP